ncbi:MAG: AAA family ATPase [Myxococcota bacterium]|nr:AAA family ATPase [Myxococcota bacterium]MDW8361727.1 AAA family ATPase [Myxococcales bacterium]
MELEKWADRHGVSVMDVKRALRESPFASKDRDYRGGATSLTRDEERYLEEKLERGELRRDRNRREDVPKPSAPAAPRIDRTDLEGLAEAVVATSRGVPRGETPYPIYLHRDVLEWHLSSETPPERRRRCVRHLQELFAFGQPTRQKSVKGVNAGWFRTPVGGTHGQQYYMWFAMHGVPVARQHDAMKALEAFAPPGARFVRAIRHHDATATPLPLGSPDEYTPLPVADLGRDEAFPDPLFDGQRNAAHSAARIRVVIGRPGAGKTTTLHVAAELVQGRVLYVTWSAALADMARAWFRVHAPRPLEIEVMTFRELLARIAPQMRLPPERSLQEAVDGLRQRVGNALSKGPWRDGNRLRAEELYAEMHAHLVGGATPVRLDETRPACEVPRMPPSAYRALRGDLGERVVDDVLRAAEALWKADSAVVAELFAGPVAAFHRALAMQRGELEVPDALAFDWFVVDEVQDLTVSELWFLVDFVARSGRRRGVRPGLVVAGDESQTVRPTAFSFGLFRRMLAERLGPEVERHELEDNLRAPEAIATLIQRADRALYRRIPRSERPAGRRPSGAGEVTVGRVARFDTSDPSSRRRLFELFAQAAGNAALIHPAAVAPEADRKLAEELNVTLWTSETAKGLEFRVVGVLDVPEWVARFDALATNDSSHAQELARSAADRLLVALSRTAETLVLAGEWAKAPAWLLGEVIAPPERAATVGAPSTAPVEGESDDGETDEELGLITAEELGELLELDASDALARIEALATQCEHLLEQRRAPEALREAERARTLLGRRDRPGAAPRPLRERVLRLCGRAEVAAALVQRDADRLQRAARRYRQADRADVATLLSRLSRASQTAAETGAPVDGEALRDVVSRLASVRQVEPALEESLMHWIAQIVDRVEARGAVALPTDKKGRAALLDGLVALAAEAPSDRDRFAQVEQTVRHRVLEQLAATAGSPAREEYRAHRSGLRDEGFGARLDARRAETDGEYALAAELYARCGEWEQALRCLRRALRWAEAARLAERVESPDAAWLRWAADLEALLERKPAGGALTDEERAHLAERVGAVLGAEVRRRRGG